MTDVNAQRYQNVLPTLQRINAALFQAATEQEILAALSLCGDIQTRLRLLMLERDAQGTLSAARIISCWPDETSIPAGDELPLVYALEKQHDPLWFIESVPAQCPYITYCPSVQGAQGMVALKLYRLGEPFLWQGIVLFLWPQAHDFTADERYLFTGLSHTASMVVDRLRLYREAIAQADRLRELDRLKTEFMYTMSHELRTPLNTIIGLSSMILSGVEGEMNPEIHTDVEAINAEGKHLLAVITDILDMAKIEAGSLALNLEDLAVAEPIIEAVRGITPAADEKGLRITTELSAHLPRLRADRLRLRQILLNLLSNAVKFSERGTIQISVTREESYLVICIRDEGIGIPPEHLEVIFEPFRQVDGRLARKQGGVGLGLAITRRLVEQHGGHIHATSTPGEGSAFYISLPVSEAFDENPVR